MSQRLAVAALFGLARENDGRGEVQFKVHVGRLTRMSWRGRYRYQIIPPAFITNQIFTYD